MDPWKGTAEGATGNLPLWKSGWDIRPTCHSCRKIRPPFACNRVAYETPAGDLFAAVDAGRKRVALAPAARPGKLPSRSALPTRVARVVCKRSELSGGGTASNPVRARVDKALAEFPEDVVAAAEQTSGSVAKIKALTNPRAERQAG